jgi:NAD(P)-dependent dehydrogenase (short-subunit alcohol dehydrogenase family)
MNLRELFDLEGRVAVVTGGSIGLGRQMAEALAELGADVVLCARRKERCQQAADELRGLGVRTLALGCNVAEPAEVRQMVDAALAAFGRIDVLVNNAGTSWGMPAEDMRLEHWNKVIDTNLTGTFLCAQAVGRAMLRETRGSIVNIASVAGLGGAHPGPAPGRRLPRQQGGRHRVHEGPGLRVGAPRHPRQRHRPGVVPHTHVEAGDRAARGPHAALDPPGPLRQRPRPQGGRCVPGLGGLGLRHGTGAGGGRRTVRLVRMALRRREGGDG